MVLIDTSLEAAKVSLSLESNSLKTKTKNFVCTALLSGTEN